jgi:hypothetical protein
MAIKVIKHGKETFKAVCPICGCEFAYQAEDLKEDCFHNHYVECPDCKNAVSHGYEQKNRRIDDLITFQGLSIIPTTERNPWPDCETCPNKPNTNKIVAGDTPCTWCIKNQPYCADMGSDLITVATNYTTDSDMYTFASSTATNSCKHVKNISKK